jgi:membrane protease YdiL (CAAX protease family)
MMSLSKALKSALNNRRSTNLPYGFEQQMMRRILLEAEQKKKRSFAWGLIVISFVSIGMIAATIYILTFYFSFSLHLTLPNLSISSQTQSWFVSCGYIAILMLALLALDRYFRHVWQKRHGQSS